MERKLASIRKIKDIQPIEGADKIELAIVDGWKVVVAKDVGHSIGDMVVYCEIDSFLPLEPEFEFLRKSSYKKLQDGTEGFRLKTIRLRGQISQGLIIPLKDAHGIIARNAPNLNIGLFEGLDVTEMLGITKYEPPIPAQLAGKIEGGFPSFIPKTDEERIQNIFDENFYNTYKDSYFTVTEKLDGTSFTAYYKDGKFGVCSRNLELSRNEDNTYWKVALEIGLEDKLSLMGKNIAIQGEMIGEGIQKNLYNLKGHHLCVFNIFDIDEHRYLTPIEVDDFTSYLDLKVVPHDNTIKLFPTVEQMLKVAEGKSELNSKVEREGLVWVTHSPNKERVSFKTISNKFLLKQK